MKKGISTVDDIWCVVDGRGQKGDLDERWINRIW